MQLLVNQIDIYKERGVPDDVIEATFTRATSVNPHYYRSYPAMMWYYRTGYSDQPEKCRDLMAEALRLNPDNGDIAWLVLDNYRWYGMGEERKHEQAIMAQDTATLQAAKDLFKQRMEVRPDNHESVWHFAKLLYEIGEYQEAWNCYQKLPDLPKLEQEHIHEFYLNKATAANGMQMYPQMLDYIDRCMANNPCDQCTGNALRLKGVYLVCQKQFDQGFSVLQSAIDKYPDNAKNFREYAYWAAQYDTNVEIAMKHIQRAIELDPEASRGYGILARLQYSQRDKTNALKNIDKAIQMDPKDDWYPKVKDKILALP